MASTSPKPLVEGVALSSTPTTIFTASSNSVVRIITGTIFNDDAGARTYSLYVVPAGATRAANHLVAANVPLAVDETASPKGLVGHILRAGDTVDAVIDSGSSVYLRLSGYEFLG